MKNFLKLFSIALLSFMTGALFNVTPLLIGVPVAAVSMLPKDNAVLGITNYDLRMVFDNAVAAFMKTFGVTSRQELLNYFKLTPSTIRLEQPLVVGKTLYTFPILDNQPLFSNTELRLKQQDSACCYSILVGTGAPGSAVDTNFTIDTYPNTQKYPTGFAAMNTIYNGTLWITVNNDQMITNWDLWKHYNANQTQQTAALGAGSPLDQNRGAYDGYYPTEPNIVFGGAKNNVIQIILPGAGVGTVDANSRLIIDMRCINAQNSTPVS